MSPFTAKEWSDIANALRTAAEQYGKDSVTCKDVPHIAQAFKDQRDEAYRLADFCDEATS